MRDPYRSEEFPFSSYLSPGTMGMRPARFQNLVVSFGLICYTHPPKAMHIPEQNFPFNLVQNPFGEPPQHKVHAKLDLIGLYMSPMGLYWATGLAAGR